MKENRYMKHFCKSKLFLSFMNMEFEKVINTVDIRYNDHVRHTAKCLYNECRCSGYNRKLYTSTRRSSLNIWQFLRDYN